jgi:hypothetical protein
MNVFIETITSEDPALKDRPFRALCKDLSATELLSVCDELEAFRRSSENLYHRVRATLFLYTAYRFFLMESPEIPDRGHIPYQGFEDLLERRFEEAIFRFRQALQEDGPNSMLMSALAESYHHLSFQTLTDQVRRSVRASRGNQWMFRVGHADDHPIRIRPELLSRSNGTILYPILIETTPVRLDLSHSGWSDIFFLGMDYPEGARVINISVELGVYGRDSETRPPVESFVRVIPEPVLRLTSIDLKTTKDITELADLFNFGNDYLSLLKAGVIASGFIPPSFEGTNQPIDKILEKIIGPGMGFELVTKVNDIPKGSRLAVSTNLLGSIVSVFMRATGQVQAIEGALEEEERRLVASRAILGEWLGGSGGGWQDSGGVWPGLKTIMGAAAAKGDPEFGISKGCLLPRHTVLGDKELAEDIDARLTDSLVLIHGGMAQNVGPILEMVSEKYLLREEAEWDARFSMREIFDNILECMRTGDIRKLAENTTRNWDEPLKTIIPWVTSHFTETIIRRSRKALGDDFWGFLMLGGMSGGGMGLFVAPHRKEAFKKEVLEILRSTKAEIDEALPFAMEPVVYDFTISRHGTMSRLVNNAEALMPGSYYALQVPELVRTQPDTIPYLRRAELDAFTAQGNGHAETFSLLRTIVTSLFRVSDSAMHSERQTWDAEADNIKAAHGFDHVQHEQIRDDIRNNRIGLSHNRLPVDTLIEDVDDDDVSFLVENSGAQNTGSEAIRGGQIAVVSLAGGVGSRWTTGAGVIKAINPFVQMSGKHRSFLEIHVAKTRKTGHTHNALVPHVVSTSFLTQGPIERHIEANNNYDHDGPIYLSPGMSIGQRLVPMVRDLVFLWEEMPQETLDEEKQKVRESVRGALMGWARDKGEGKDYSDNVAIQRFNPPGHWYEVPNLFLNNVLHELLRAHPEAQTLMLHNIDTLGADVDPTALGMHLQSGNVLTFEVVPRRFEDRGGGLARVNGKVRLLEGLAQPREEDELKLSYYNSMTTWIQIDPLLECFGLTRQDILDKSDDKIGKAIRAMARRMPTYVTIKDVKRRWGHGQEDVYPVAQFEKLWSDMSGLADVPCGFIVVPRMRGQQLKDPNQLDPWANDGSKAHIEGLCDFPKS